jgi:hypothetical protein
MRERVDVSKCGTWQSTELSAVPQNFGKEAFAVTVV